MSIRNYHADRARAHETAKAIIAQGRGKEVFPPMGGVMEVEPMHRYTHPIPPADQCAPTCEISVQDYFGRILEGMACQQQLLVDILGAINSLTAATLSTYSRQHE